MHATPKRNNESIFYPPMHDVIFIVYERILQNYLAYYVPSGFDVYKMFCRIRICKIPYYLKNSMPRHTAVFTRKATRNVWMCLKVGYGILYCEDAVYSVL